MIRGMDAEPWLRQPRASSHAHQAFTIYLRDLVPRRWRPRVRMFPGRG
jgi:hypothetical protein